MQPKIINNDTQACVNILQRYNSEYQLHQQKKTQSEEFIAKTRGQLKSKHEKTIELEKRSGVQKPFSEEHGFRVMN